MSMLPAVHSMNGKHIFWLGYIVKRGTEIDDVSELIFDERVIASHPKHR